jgi:hypothetical protein
MLAIAIINTVYLRQVHDRILLDDALVGDPVLASALRRPISLVCTNWRKSMRSYPIPTPRYSRDVYVDLHVSDSAPTHFDGLYQVGAISSASFRLLDSNEDWFKLFHEKRTNADVTIGSHLHE